ncbi:hypothetical protein PPSIR1_20389 [Plesiocystis pacifica SIR-1]|uniref:Uncharacterized protein n=1 Tax=Plesiocystis pacifica SIR-1 TaxID=391625 RepID=A6G254_9BACT|nr:hypothetical protein [Plesiocystis pacifica]EDM80023.1 hypothetical protein PPSIR1_20389 [Plesiocystis pacifica SIR-1]
MALAPLISACLLLGPATPPPATSDAEATEPQPSAPATSDADAAEPGEPAELPTGGIDFAVPPPEGETEDEGSDPASVEGPAPAAPPEDDLDYSPLYGSSIGTAPPDGAGGIVAGAMLLPVAVGATWLLTGGDPISGIGDDRVPILVAGTGLGIVGVGALGLGLYRMSKNRRWMRIRGVEPLPQGAGLLTAGGMSINFGAVAVLSGSLFLARDQVQGPIPASMIVAGGLSLAVAAPLTLIYGKRRSRNYAATGGWRRRPLPPVPTQPTGFFLPGGFGVGVQGRF